MWGAENGVRDGDAAAEDGGVFDVVDAVVVLDGVFVWFGGTYSKDAVCSMPTTRVMISSLSGGTFNQRLNAAMHWLRMSFPGCPYK